MTLLKFDGPSHFPVKSKFTSATKKPLKLIFGIGALAGIISLGSTLAANIALNTGAPIEFGQGVAQTTSCDADVTVTPYSTFVNSEGAGAFALSSINVSGISSDCAGKEFTIKAYSDSPSTQLDLLDGVSAINVLDSGSKFAIATTTGLSITSDGNTGFTLTFDAASSPVSADSVYRITIESSDDSGAIAITYSVGESGPGSGTVFYYSVGGFNEVGAACSPSCHYLEWAPNTWNGGTEDPILALDAGMTRNSGLDGVIGVGLFNTNYMLANSATAAIAVRGYHGGGKLDWFIASQEETDLMFASPQLSSGGFAANNYWSSSERRGNYNAWLKNFSTGDWLDWEKSDTLYVRPIRAF